MNRNFFLIAVSILLLVAYLYFLQNSDPMAAWGPTGSIASVITLLWQARKPPTATKEVIQSNQIEGCTNQLDQTNNAITKNHFIKASKHFQRFRMEFSRLNQSVNTTPPNEIIQKIDQIEFFTRTTRKADTNQEKKYRIVKDILGMF